MMLSLWRGVLLVAMAAALLLVVAGPVYGFDVPRLGIITVTSAALLVGTMPAFRRRWVTFDVHVRALITVSAGFALWAVVATVAADVPRLSIIGQQSRFVGAAALIAPVVLVVVLPTILPTTATIDRAIGVFTVMIGAGGVYGVVQFVGADPMPWAVAFGGRPVSFFGNSNFVGAVLCVGAPLAWWVWMRGGRWRAAAVVLFVAVATAMWAADVRLGLASATIGLVAFALALVDLPWRRLQGWLIAAVPVGGVAAGLVTIASAAVLIDDRNGLARVSFWRTAARMWADAPLVGQGPGRFEPAYRALRSPTEVTAGGVAPRDLPVDTSHAFVVDLAATMGTPAVLLWFAVLVLAGLLLRTVWLRSASGPQRARVAVLVGMLGAHGAQSSMSVPIITTVWIGWFLIGLTIAVAVADDAGARPTTARRPAVGRRRPSARRRPTRRVIVVARDDLIAAGLAVIVAVVAAVPAAGFFRSTTDVGASTSLLRAEQADDALAAGERATQRTPWWPEAWHVTARAARALEDLDGTSAAASAALAADPHDRTALLLLAEVDQRQQGIDAARPWFDQLRALDPNGVDLHLDVLRFALAIGDDALAAEARTVIEAAIGPDDAVLWERYVQLG